jgi:hypothetical protein
MSFSSSNLKFETVSKIGFENRKEKHFSCLPGRCLPSGPAGQAGPAQRPRPSTPPPSLSHARARVTGHVDVGVRLRPAHVPSGPRRIRSALHQQQRIASLAPFLLPRSPHSSAASHRLASLELALAVARARRPPLGLCQSSATTGKPWQGSRPPQ